MDFELLLRVIGHSIENVLQTVLVSCGLRPRISAPLEIH